MSIRRKVGRYRAVIAAVALAISTLALPASQPAVAQDVCDPSEPNVFATWTMQHNDRGVTVCVAGTPPLPSWGDAVVQIVDLTAGAKVRLISDAVDDQDPPDVDNQYNTREADDWFSHIQSTVVTPAPSRLFSTTNASFFDDTSGGTTSLSFPEMSLQRFPDHSTHTLTLGSACCGVGSTLKRALVIGNASSSQQSVAIQGFPANYDVPDVFDFYDGGDDGTVAFDPLQGSGSARRTFVGVSPGGPVTKVYTLTTSAFVTLGAAQDILKSFGSQVEIQLDGGGSAQTYCECGTAASIPSIVSRDVPDVLAVYLGP